MQKLEQAQENSPDELAPEDVPEQSAAVVIKEAKAPKVLHTACSMPLSGSSCRSRAMTDEEACSISPFRSPC